MSNQHTFSGGLKLVEKLGELSRKLSKGAQVRVGFLEGATESLNGEFVAQVAAFQEWGTNSIPPRPFFRPMIAHYGNDWGEQLGKVLNFNDYDAAKSLAQMGELIGGELQESIIAVSEPALSDITLMLRKMRSEDQSLIVTGKTVGEAARRVAAGEDVGDVSRKPLVDTGDMLNSVAYQVDDGAQVFVDESKSQ